MLEGVPRKLAEVREGPLTTIVLWAIVLGAVALDLTTLREPQQDRVVIVVAVSLASLLVYGVIRLLIGRGMANERVHDVCVQLAGFLILFLGIVAVFALARALTDRLFAATMAVFHGAWALGALDGYRRGIRQATESVETTEPRQEGEP